MYEASQAPAKTTPVPLWRNRNYVSLLPKCGERPLPQRQGDGEPERGLLHTVDESDSSFQEVVFVIRRQRTLSFSSLCAAASPLHPAPPDVFVR